MSLAAARSVCRVSIRFRPRHCVVGGSIQEVIFPKTIVDELYLSCTSFQHRDQTFLIFLFFCTSFLQLDQPSLAFSFSFLERARIYIPHLHLISTFLRDQHLAIAVSLICFPLSFVFSITEQLLKTFFDSLRAFSMPFISEFSGAPFSEVGQISFNVVFTYARLLALVPPAFICSHWLFAAIPFKLLHFAVTMRKTTHEISNIFCAISVSCRPFLKMSAIIGYPLDSQRIECKA
mmetsp:Transcript_14044/g.23085  ORF Transcript_14044/g.23085 Transcript_14044/m.23085 type:complete len:234 (-) Transcript_14044:1418-2119(-)